MSDLIERLEAIADHDWRISFLAHTSDTAREAADTLRRAAPATAEPVATEADAHSANVTALLALHSDLVAARADEYRMIDASQYDPWPGIILRAATALERLERRASSALPGAEE